MIRKLLLVLLLLALPGAASALRQITHVSTLPAVKPVAVAVDRSGLVFTAQQEWSVTVSAADGEKLRILGGKPQGKKEKPLLVRPRGVAFIQDRTLVVDSELGRVVIFDREGRHLGDIGREGSGLKEFDEPAAIATWGDLIFVADTGNDRIQVLGPNGVFIRVIGRAGSGDALLRKPVGISVDPRGRVHVIDGEAGAVKVYSIDGEFLSRLAAARGPSAIVTDDEGFYLIEQQTFKVCKYDFSGKQLFCFGARGNDSSQFLALDGLAVDGSGQVFVSDRSRGAVQVLQPDAVERSLLPDRSITPTSVLWNGEAPLPQPGRMARSKSGKLYSLRAKTRTIVVLGDGKEETSITLPKWHPVALALGPDDGLWVLDAEHAAVLKLDDQGKIVHKFGSSGSGEGYFSDPADLAVSSKGIVYVADRGNSRVQIFSASGTYLSQIANKGERVVFASPAALALDGNDNLLVLDQGRRSVSVFNHDGERLVEMGGSGDGPGRLQRPLALAVSANEIFVFDGKSQTVKTFSPTGNFQREFGSPGQGPGEFGNSAALLLLTDTELLVADTSNNRQQNFRFSYTPSPPTSPKAEAGMRRVALTWAASPESYVSDYHIYRSRSQASGYQQVAASTGTAWVDADVSPEVTYYYRVTASAHSGNESNWSGEVQAMPAKAAASPPEEISAIPQEWSVDLTWRPGGTAFLAGYNIYRDIEGKTVPLGKVEVPTFYEGSLEPETAYTFHISAVSVDGVESARVPVKVTTLVATKPPIEIGIVELHDIFSNTYKIYENEGMGSIRITNNTRDQISKIKVAFAIKEFMDFPTELEISNLGPRESKEVVLKAVFNTHVLNVTEDTAVQTEITASFYKNQDLKTYSRTLSVNIFEKHRMLWEERGRFAAFVTPKDPIVLDFSRGIVTQYSEFSDPILYAGVIFDALGVHGISYLQDPSNPYQLTSGKVDFVDYLQYPRETLQRKSGDCDDLVGLYSSLLESLGIRTKVVEVPGHMFLIFSTEMESGAPPNGLAALFVEHDGSLWVPVEVTQIGAPFMKAWEAGAANYAKWKDQGLTLMDTRANWEQFKPANLAMTEWRAPLVQKVALEARYREELPTLRKIRALNLGRAHIARLRVNPDDTGALLQLGIINARAGELEEAARLFEKVRGLLPDSAAVANNLGNVYLLSERYVDAAKAYAEAVRIEPQDADVWVNLARCRLRLGEKETAASAFRTALELDPATADKFRGLALALGPGY
ncbi:MAG: hypothetical protein A2091_06400 [Desulfuromonadales bacterium GWD2_61_12]|nr:MAG: hypothetical protein A2091_06400 [Desulfuromonadales bacterium GWD2_61_12]OGR32852.1 MAG: hypothetical protein A2005_09460 [Desulfuromonadales bacterium GWC2_61_20]HAD05308.1 hypothetical protein [Desulfuromonas sp.]HBT83409.1 hypothetical protein [Desulfuromonas sp.]